MPRGGPPAELTSAEGDLGSPAVNGSEMREKTDTSQL